MLATIYPKDVEPTAPEFDFATFTPRRAGRAIVFDGDKVALVRVTVSGFYMLPGGGVEDEEMHAALAREVSEELGIAITIKREVGAITVYFDRWMRIQTDTCYIAQKVGETNPVHLTEFEASEGFEPVWASNLNEAAMLVRDAHPKDRDGKLIQARDLLFLNSALSLYD